MFTVTYAIVTPESAEQGDYAEHGYVLPGGWHQSVDDCVAELQKEYPGEEWRKHWPPAFAVMPLQDAARLCCPDEDSGNWFSETSGRENYKTGDNETRSLHPPDNITAASYARLKRVFNIR